MTMPSSGTLNLAGTSTPVSAAQELGLGLTTSISMNQANVRTLAGVGGSGTAWNINSLYGKSNRASVSYTYSANTANAALNVNTISGYSAGTSDITVTINSGVYLYATSTGSYGLNLTGGTSGDTITVVNNGYIMGQGGNGGGQSSVTIGSAGGPAFNVGTGINITVNNTNGAAYIGGGGGGGRNTGNTSDSAGSGGGAGGGTGGTGYNCSGGSGGGIGSSGANGGFYIDPCTAQARGAGGGGGRIFPGSGGAAGSGWTSSATRGSGGGAGGGGGSGFPGGAGAGGSANSGGAGSGTYSGSGGGGWGASGGSGYGGGNAVVLNGKTVTWTSGDTSRVYGAIS